MKSKTPASTKSTGGSLAKAVEGMLPEIRGLIEEAWHRAVTAANLSMVTLYWNVGRIINTELQRAPGRAEKCQTLSGELEPEMLLEIRRLEDAMDIIPGPGHTRVTA